MSQNLNLMIPTETRKKEDTDLVQSVFSDVLNTSANISNAKRKIIPYQSSKNRLKRKS